MPTYTVTAPEGCLNQEKRSKIAQEITRVHSETTGAPTYFAQVIFNDIAPGKYFVGGMPLHGQQVFVNGQRADLADARGGRQGSRAACESYLGLYHRSDSTADG
jgi:phenylpyruvate tautomerase PptA (4-oxalocrotonate tautomerase family)